MGYMRSEHIQAFARGKTIADVRMDADDVAWIVFTNGEKLCLYPYANPLSIIATPFHADDTVKQSTEIMAEQATVVTQEE